MMMCLASLLIIAHAKDKNKTKTVKKADLPQKEAVERPDVNANPLNIFDEALTKCSRPGTAITGYGSTGKCLKLNDGSGSSNLCVDISKLSRDSYVEEDAEDEKKVQKDGTDGKGKKNKKIKTYSFCEITNQHNWCSTKFRCHDNKDMECPIHHYCVSQWDFALYLETIGGCDRIADDVIDCEATSMQIYEVYNSVINNSTRVPVRKQKAAKAALDCIESRCKKQTQSTAKAEL